MNNLRRAGLPVLLLSACLLAGCQSDEEKAKGYYEHGLAIMAAGQLDQAAIEFRRALKLREHYTDALFGLAQVEEKRRNFDVAAKIYFSIAQSDAGNLEARIRLAQFLLTSNQVDEASTYAEQAAKLKPRDPRVLVVMAGVALGRGKNAEAVRLAEDALSIAPDDRTALMVLVSERMAADDSAGALALLQRILNRDSTSLDIQLLRLRVLTQMGRDGEVGALLGQLPQLFPASAEVQDAKVSWLLGKGRNAEAEAAVRQFARANPADEQAGIRLAVLVSRTRGPAAAAGELKDIIAVFPAGEALKLTRLKLALAQLEQQAGQTDAAIALLQEAIAAVQDAASRSGAQVQLARILADRRQWQQVAELSEAVLAGNPRDAQALTVRAAARLATGRGQEAVADLVAALGEKPNAPNIMLMLGEAYEQTGSSVLAEEQYSKALAFSGYAPETGIRMARFLMRYGRADQAMQELDVLRTHGTADTAVLSLLAQLKLNAGDWQDAQELAAELRKLKDAPAAAAADRIDVAALTGMKRTDDALALLTARVLQFPGDAEAAGALADALLEAGRIAEAETMVRERLKRDPSGAVWNVRLGSALVAAGKTDEAEATFAAAAADGAGGAEASAALTQFYLRTGRPGEAEQAARAGLSREQDSSALRLLLAEVLEARGKFDAAIAEYEALIRSDPTSTVVANNLASLLSGRGDAKSLEQAYNIAIRFQNSSVPQFVDTLGWVAYLRGDHYDAVPLLQRAADGLPDLGVVQFHLGMALKAVGKSEASAAALRRAVKLAPPEGAGYLAEARAALEQMKTMASAN